LGESRGDRVRLVREALGLQQTEFTERLNQMAEALGIESRYDFTKVSKMEVGTRKVSLDDAIVLAELDPKRRGVRWMATGIAVAPAPAPALTPPNGAPLARGFRKMESEAMIAAKKASAKKTGRKSG
jgi:transcriptional regulator with XRE-family HTH domain